MGDRELFAIHVTAGVQSRKILILTRRDQLAFLTPCDQALNPPFLGGKIIELAKFCFKNKRFEPSLSFFCKQVIVSHCV